MLLLAGLFVIKIAEDRFIFEWSLESFYLHLQRIQADFGFNPPMEFPIFSAKWLKRSGV